MHFRRFGRSDIQVSELVFGGGWVGGILVHADDDTKREALRRALAGGINWIDTAPSYGQGQSETALGWLLPELEAKPHVSTKVRIDPAKLDDIPGQIERSLTGSLTRLGRDSVDLLQLHNPITVERSETTLAAADVLAGGAVADSLDRLREQGLYRLTGITALGDAGAIVDVVDSGRFDSAQVYYNLLNPSCGWTVPTGWSGHDFRGVIDACKRNDVATMCIRVFAAGVIASDQRHGREVPVVTGADLAVEEMRAKAAFDALGDRYGTRAQTAIRFALSNPDLSCVIFGLAELDHLEQALGAAENGPLPDEALGRLRELHQSDFGRL